MRSGVAPTQARYAVVINMSAVHPGGTNEIKPQSATQRLRRAVARYLREGQWPALAVLRDRFPDVPSGTINKIRNDLVKQLGIKGRGMETVDLAKLDALVPDGGAVK